jgi:hypothetical protein
MGETHGLPNVPLPESKKNALKRWSDMSKNGLN